MLALVVSHLLVALALPWVAARNTRAAFTVAALPPAAALVWTLGHAGAVLGGQEIVESLAWAPRLGLEITFRLDPLALLMTVLVSGIGVLVLLYCPGYFGPGSADGRRSAPLLLAFAGVMLGLVLADDLLLVYVFWELTTICSFLLVGQSGISREQRRSAMQALVVTIFGGLVMLLGFVVLGEAAGTYRISELVADPPGGGAMAAAAVLILIGAFTKSAQLPFHNWLPAAMVAPTPVSAYLHAASMVKAGVFLVARLTPVFAGVVAWPVLTAVFGLLTMIVAGWRALHEYDLKILLAYGTVSQLGFVMVLVGAGTHTGAVAGTAMLLAHGLFKSALFLVVGIVDHEAGSRDIRELSGLGRRLPWLVVIAVPAAASMAGLPPTLGFLGKEAAFEVFLHGGAGQAAIAAGLVLGSVFTVGYSARLLWGAFANKPGIPATAAHAPGAGLLLPAAVPALAGVVLGVVYPAVDELSAAYAAVFEAGTDPYHLALWHGLNLALLCSLIALAGGLVVHAARTPITRVRGRLVNPLNAQRAYERSMALLERVAVGVTGRVQAGSLPTYLGIILLTVLAVSGTALLTRSTPIEQFRAWDRILQVPLAIAILIAVAGVVRARRRLTAVLLVGVIGYGIGGIFIIDGAPDLALTQFLVETLTLVAFVFVLRRLPVRFTQSDPAPGLRWVKMLIAVGGGVFMAFASMIFSSARQTPSGVSEQYIARAEQGAGATNVVNAIIVDFRAFDTIGEISVLAVAATGVASLILTSRHERRRRRGSLPITERSAADESAAPGNAGAAGPIRPGTGEDPQGRDPRQEEVRE
ncbi:multicomponent Na+:H+ antiporter subunit A [Halopolyspora algeriensis]|uniref:Multicomponent Na+:H+ antiporter subunit A n=1 Tax=Halopolyspora algeriensis TaxID=1500506 RepID=A0A368VTE3_9ACTN|nr:multicomponent Na+:H+ antiporter subunit A [Halopolyspora algeriensis]TQM47490.1 multicomponent Na+:H+ antiporter subunit A [Halopolyspora algeriensis]